MITLYEELDTPREGLVLHYAKDENDIYYCILQVETNIVYESAVDKMPCRYTYQVTDVPITSEETVTFIKELSALQ
jgi:hypothetical protein